MAKQDYYVVVLSCFFCRKHVFRVKDLSIPAINKMTLKINKNVPFIPPKAFQLEKENVASFFLFNCSHSEHAFESIYKEMLHLTILLRVHRAEDKLILNSKQDAFLEEGKSFARDLEDSAFSSSIIQ